jgi:hypothetical protein
MLAVLMLGEALAAPDLRVSIVTPFCYAGYLPRVIVGVSNDGDAPASAYLDVFVDLPAAPSVGTTSTIFRRTGTVQPYTTRFYTFDLLDAPARETWVDVIVDTDQIVFESNELNNVSSSWADFTGCYIP